MIPKLLHYVWVGTPLPDHQRRNIDTWRRTNPDFEIIQWDESNIDFSHAAVRDAHARRRWAKVADIARLMAVRQQGGFYLDVDFHLYRSLNPLRAHPCVFGFQTKAPGTDWVSNGMIGAQPSHWFIAKAVDRVLSIPTTPFGFDRPTKYGPKLVTRLLMEEGLESYGAAGAQVRDVFVAPTEAFFPWAYGEAFREDCVTPASYGIHLWEKSWERELPVWVRAGQVALKQVRRLRRAALR